MLFPCQTVDFAADSRRYEQEMFSSRWFGKSKNLDHEQEKRRIEQKSMIAVKHVVVVWLSSRWIDRRTEGTPDTQWAS